MKATLPELLRLLEEREGLIPAWEVVEVERGVLSLFDVTGTPTQVAYLSVERTETAPTSAALVEAGHPPGGYASGSGVVWRETPTTFRVWDDDGRGLDADHARLKTRFEDLERSAVNAVVPWVSDDQVHRNVSVRVGVGTTTIATEIDHAGEMDSWYMRKGWKSIGWVSKVSYQLAKWLDVEIQEVNAADD